MPGAMSVHTDPLADHYLHCLDAAGRCLHTSETNWPPRSVPPQKALRQIRAGDKAALLNVLGRVAIEPPPGSHVPGIAYVPRWSSPR
jgi:hypothetical protein